MSELVNRLVNVLRNLLDNALEDCENPSRHFDDAVQDAIKLLEELEGVDRD